MTGTEASSGPGFSAWAAKCRIRLALLVVLDEFARTKGARGAGTRRPARARVIGRRANMVAVGLCCWWFVECGVRCG